MHADARDHGTAVALGRRRAAENHVTSVAQPNLLANAGGAFLDRQALAGQSSLRGLQRDRLDQPSVGGNGVSFLDQDNVTKTRSAAAMVCL
jgi:hypothetical protein